jgi:protoheme IX farnesyltransferase
MNRLQKLTLATAGTTIVLFAVGGLVRGTDSGLGCSTWPNCEPGRLFPSGTIHSFIEFSHRALVFVVTALIAWTAIEAFRLYRGVRAVLGAAVAAVPLVVGQAVLGGIVVHTELDPWWVTAHFAAALALVADVTFLAVRALLLGRGPEPAERDRGFARLAWVSTGALAALLLVGTFVRARDAGLAFTDWPLLGGRLVPALDGYTTPMFLHRLLAALVFLLVLWVAIRARTAAARAPELVKLSTVLLALFAAQILSGAANVWSRLRPWAVVLHVALSVLIWATMVAVATVADRLARPARASAEEAPGTAPPGEEIRARITAYVRLTKPRIVVLLLITTVPAMVLAAEGIPSVGLMVATLLGGAIAAGSANAVNMYLDRDIDEVMRRTRQRPLPSHAVTPEHALRFGFVLGAFSFYFLAITVNVLAATLSLSAIAFYVFVYTMWLKRSSPQNIVIGGAAGAVPVLVGWAAVTGTVALPAWVLFAIVFVWTPPHFWALSMRFRGDYAAAGVPMLPVVRGEDETRRQIFLYSLVLFAVTLLLVPVGRMGPVYLATALVLGGSFVYRSLRLWREGGDVLAWGLFRYSIVYLAALFGAVAVDAIVS